MYTTAIAPITAQDQLHQAEKLRSGYPLDILRRMTYDELVIIADDLRVDVAERTNKGVLLARINKHINTQVGLAKYRVQEENKGHSQAPRAIQEATSTEHPTHATRINESDLDKLTIRLQNVSGRHADCYRHVAEKLMQDIQVARNGRTDVVAHALLALYLYAAATGSQQLRTCYLRVAAIIEGK